MLKWAGGLQRRVRPLEALRACECSHKSGRPGPGARHQIRARTRIAAVALCCTFVVFGFQAEGRAETFTNAAERCAQNLVDNLNPFICPSFLLEAGVTQFSDAHSFADATLLDVQTTVNTTQPGQVAALSALVADAIGQFEDLSGLRAYVDAGTDEGGLFVEAGAFRNGSQVLYTEQRVSHPIILSATSSESSASGFSTAKFTPMFDAKAYWDPNRSGSCKCADGIAVWNVYRASPQFHQAFDFYAIGLWSSVTPRNGKTFKRLLQQIYPKENPEIVEADPLIHRTDNDGGSLTVGVSLGAQSGAPGGGGSFSISRTWNYSRHVILGRVFSSELQQLDSVSTNKNGDSYSRSTTGASTWKVPKKRAAKWGAGAAVYYID